MQKLEKRTIEALNNDTLKKEDCPPVGTGPFPYLACLGIAVDLLETGAYDMDQVVGV